MEDFYSVLQVTPHADIEVIKAAHKHLMKKYHPDIRGSGNEDTAIRVNRAFEILSDNAKRKKYNKELEDLEGKKIGNYELVEKIAEGGYGNTYKARHIVTDGLACIKHRPETSPVLDEVIINETKAIWDLRHFAIPTVRDLHKLDDGTYALIMSFVPGPTIEEIVEDKGRLNPEDVSWITDRILNALLYLHMHGVIHGDIKPQNIIIQPKSHTVVLIDYGLAMIEPRGSDRSKGYTEIFAPPEQLTNRPLIPQSDYYALGMTMLYMLNGNVKDVAKKNVPSDTPDALCNFVVSLIKRDVLSRPEYGKVNLQDELMKVRKKSFGRVSSFLKPIFD